VHVPKDIKAVLTFPTIGELDFNDKHHMCPPHLSQFSEGFLPIAIGMEGLLKSWDLLGVWENE
jgi:hypothetical protein